MEFELFETVKVEDKKAAFVNRHYERIKRSAAELNFPFDTSIEEFKNSVENAAPEKGVYLVKFAISIGGKCSVSVRECLIPEKVSLAFYDGIKRKNDLLSRHKTSSVYESIIAVRKVRKKGFAEVILSDVNGFISETAFANIFFIKNGIFFTPSCSTGCLPGTRRSVILTILKEMQIPVFEGFFTKEDIMNADEVIITSARYDAVSVYKIENKIWNLPENAWGKRLREVINQIKFLY
ncbi:aminotransferase class IV [Desulfurobacterium sp.]